MDPLFGNIDFSLIESFSNNPFEAMWFFLVQGGWLILIWICVWGAIQVWVDWRQGLYAAKRKFILLAISIPRMHEQGPRAVDNMFAYIAGAHSTNSWRETWIDGRTQDTLSFEIVSIDGQVQFMVRTIRNFRDLVEAAVYSQYPDAEIHEVEDYATKVPSHFPDEEWDVWGTEMVPVKADIYPLKTYPMFEDSVSGEFKDPLSAMLESMSRLGPGEQAWFQIILVPIGQADFAKKATEAVKKMKGEVKPPEKNIIEKILEIPFGIALEVIDAFTGATPPKTPVKKEGPGQPKIMGMTQGEKDVIGAIEMKMSKIVYLTKLRFAYVAKKAVMSKPRMVNTFIGAIKQLNTNNWQALKPDTKHIPPNGNLIFFKNTRNNHRKHHLIVSYRNRSHWAGTPRFHMNTEELATLWHFPHSMQVKAPQIKKTEAKRTEPPINLPFG